MIQFHFEFQLLVELVSFLSTFTKSEGTIENVCFGCNVDVNGVKYWSKYVRDCAPERVSVVAFTERLLVWVYSTFCLVQIA